MTNNATADDNATVGREMTGDQPRPAPDTYRLLPENIRELVALSPANPTIRSLLEQHVGIPLPPETLALGDIEQWVNRNWVPNKPAVEGQLRVILDYSRTEYGRANYSVNQTGQQNVYLDWAELADLAADADNWDAFVESVDALISEWSDSSDVEFVNDDNYEYEHHESNDSSNFDWSERGIPDRNREVVQYFQANFPDLYERLTQ